MVIVLQLVLTLCVILVAAAVFTNALEHLGEKLEISEGVTGSLFAAVGTALPETVIPLIALLAGTRNAEVNAAIGVGAILGAPLMLSTLSIALMSLAVLPQRGVCGTLKPEPTGLARDLTVFLCAFALATVALYVPHGDTTIRATLAISLVLIYFVYIVLTVQASEKLVEEGHGAGTEQPLLLTKLGLPKNAAVIVAQLVLGLLLLVGGAKGFVYGVEAGSKWLGISALLLSLLIVPIATELPEKINSILWIRRRKDTLAFGNITGAMVFQGTLLPAIGMVLTPWEPGKEVLASVVLTLVGASWIRAVHAHGTIRVWHLLLNGALYIVYLAIVLVH